MCWNIRIGRCSHPEPTPDLLANLAICRCNRYTTSWDPTPCNPCNDFLVESTISQADFIDIQMYNRNITYFLQSTNDFGIKYDHLPESIGDWVALPSHVRFMVNGQGTLMEGTGVENNPDGAGTPIIPDEGQLSDSNSTLVWSDSSTASENGRNEVPGGMLDDPLPVIREEEAGAY
ncbi:uncharacterized protein DFL_000385 [Arthrobotrys flagrans]|uniref:Uncharacterized protein n=1 Tax=Arthrobotrys flagrans TaxID=97331 RepID=A0A437ADM1_ARTFL|nr:hypothetical protein DFL_000385 [Arthrobotrys flagrans]